MPNKMKSNNPPRRVDIRGQDHLLAYITPAEAQLLMDNGGSGEPGPMGIPAFDMGEGQGGDGMGGDMGGDDGGGGGGPTGGRGGGRASAGMDTARGGPSGDGGGSYADLGISPGQSQAQFGTPGYAGLSQDQAIAAAEADNNPFAAGVAATRAKDIQALQDLNKQLQNLSRREAVAKSLPGLFGRIAQQNVSNLAMGLLGKDLSFGQSFGFSDLGLDALNPSVSDLVAAQQNAITDAFGNVVGITDDYGTLQYGYDPSATGPDGGGPEIVPTQTNPVTGQEECPSGYTFDGDINACRIDAPLENVVGGTGFDYEPGTYARMGLLDVAPEGLEQFASTYGTGFGTAPDYEAANLAYRKPVGTMSGIFQDPYNLEGMTLLS